MTRRCSRGQHRQTQRYVSCGTGDKRPQCQLQSQPSEATWPWLLTRLPNDKQNEGDTLFLTAKAQGVICKPPFIYGLREASSGRQGCFESKGNWGPVRLAYEGRCLWWFTSSLVLCQAEPGPSSSLLTSLGLIISVLQDCFENPMQSCK